MAVLRAVFVVFVTFVFPSVDYATPLRFSIAAERSIVIAV